MQSLPQRAHLKNTLPNCQTELARTSQFTVKVYRSEKIIHEDGSWEHGRIRMIPLNPEFEEWNLKPDEFKVIGEFVAVLPSEE